MPGRTTFYIEYLVIGGVGLLFFMLFLDTCNLAKILSNFKSSSFSGASGVLIIIPAAYILGILIDAIGYIFFELPLRFFSEDEKEGVSQIFRFFQSFGSSQSNKDSSLSRTAEIAAYNAHVAELLSGKRSRDRIVRGSMLVSLASGIYSIYEFGTGFLILVCSLFLFFVWLVFHRSTRKFKAAAYALATDKGHRTGK